MVVSSYKINNGNMDYDSMNNLKPLFFLSLLSQFLSCEYTLYFNPFHVHGVNIPSSSLIHPFDYDHCAFMFTKLLTLPHVLIPKRPTHAIHMPHTHMVNFMPN